MSFLGRLNARVNALANNTLGSLLSRIDRLDDWWPDSPPERTDYQALWQEAVAPVHPIIDARVRLRVIDQNIGDRYACRQPTISAALDALDANTQAALAAETLKRFAFLDYCVWISFNDRQNEALARLDNFGISRDALIALEYDYEGLATHLLSRSKPGLDADQTAAVAHVAGFIATSNPHCTSVKELITPITPVLCDPLARKDERKRQALASLFNRLGEGQSLIARPDAVVIALIEAIAKITGVPPETHPIVQAKRANDALIEEARQAVVALGGSHLKRFFENATKNNATSFSKESAEVAGLDALMPSERAEALLHVLRVLNFVSHCGAHPSNATWPEGKYTGFRRADYPHLRDYPGHAGLPLVDLFQDLARRKVELNEDMQAELLQILRSGVANNLVRSLQVVKIIEGCAKGNSSIRVHKELEATVEWLRGVSDHYGVKFKAAALHRLEKALAAMASPEGASPAVTPLAKAPAEAASPVAGVRLPGGFGRRAAPPPGADSTLAAPRAPVEPASLAPPRGPESSGRPTSIIDFYGDLADLRKCSAEHIAFLDRQIAGETDVETETRRRIAIRPMLRGLTEEQQARAEANIRADVVREREQHRALMEMLKTRVLVVARVAGEAPAIWAEFHDHARALYGKSKPAAAWLKRAHQILDAVPTDAQAAMVKASASGYPCYGAHYPTDDVVRGLIYSAVRLPAEKVGTAVADFARRECFQTVPGSGIRDKRMGNACLWTLIHMPDGAGIPYLARLLNGVKYPSVKKMINAALDEAAEKAGLSRGSLDELSAPTHDLEDGRKEMPVGPAGAAMLEIVGTADVAIAFRRADGKTTASVPTELKEFKPEIAAARAAAKEIEADLTTQIARLQRIWLENRDWSFADWQARYADHPLLAALTRRLIWDVSAAETRRSAVLVDGALSDIEGKPVDASDARISLWHPIGRPLAEVLGWRKRLTSLGIVQPFKQAHREVSYVTDAERATGIYSNRFAGHILRQHQMIGLHSHL